MESQLTSNKTQIKYPSRFLANTFLLIGIGILVAGGRLSNNTLAQYLIGSFSELILALTAILCVRINKLPVKQTMRFHWTGWAPLLLSVIAAPGLWFMGVVLNIITSFVLGYTTPTPPQMYPTTLWESLGFLLTAVIIAPICEEIIFRGYIQPAYERGKPIKGMIITGLIFALYHMQFQGMFALLPVAFALGFLLWQTGSVLPGIVLHAAYNSIASVILISSILLPYPITTGLLLILVMLGLFGTVGTVISFWILWRSPGPRNLIQTETMPRQVRWAWVIPLLLLILIYTYGSVSEIIAGRFPQFITTDVLALHPQPAWKDEVSWAYDIQDVIGTKLGTAECTIMPVVEAYQLSCQGQNQSSSILDQTPWDFPWLASKFDISASDWERIVLWQNNDLQITTFIENQFLLNRTATLNTARQKLIVEFDNEVRQEYEIPTNALVYGEWPWRLAGLPHEMFYSGYMPLIALNEDGDYNLYQAFVSVRSAEPIWTTVGSFITWKVTVSYKDNAGKEITETAWYDTVAPHPLIRYDNGQINYIIRNQNIQEN